MKKFYFVHSYHVAPENPSDILTWTDYGLRFTSGIQKGNVVAVQFHPEKSGEPGLAILKNFLECRVERKTPKKPASKHQDCKTNYRLPGCTLE